MHPDNRLPLLKRALAMLVNELDARDRVAMVVYAGASGLVLPPTRGNHTAEILEAIGRLEAGGSTNGAAGLELAYRIAKEAFVAGGQNRIVLATDGDFNVGMTSEQALERAIAEHAKSGVYLSVLGFGKGNLKDSMMEKLADRGNGNYAYIDTLEEARKVLVEQMTGTLITIAKDVKLQVELDPKRVRSYRQIGYEDRLLRNEDFANDKVDAGDIGAGHTVTALYELEPVGAARAGESLGTVRVRYKPLSMERSLLTSSTIVESGASYAQASGEFKFAAAVAEYGMLLEDSPNRGDATWADALALAHAGRGDDPHGYRGEFIQLAELAARLQKAQARR
jgi:Ca-activated chloride channel family protein